MTLGERVIRRIVRKLPMWQPALANRPTLSRDLTAHAGTSLERRAPRQRKPRARWDRAISVSDYVWVCMETGRIDRLKFGSVVVLPDDALVRGARGLMPLPGGGFAAVQRISSSDLATFVDRAEDGMLPSPGDLRNIRDETCPVSRDESGDKTNLRDNLSIRPPTDEERPWGPTQSLAEFQLARRLLRSTNGQTFRTTRWRRIELVGKLVAAKTDQRT